MTGIHRGAARPRSGAAVAGWLAVTVVYAGTTLGRGLAIATTAPESPNIVGIAFLTSVAIGGGRPTPI